MFRAILCESCFMSFLTILPLFQSMLDLNDKDKHQLIYKYKEWNIPHKELEE